MSTRTIRCQKCGNEIEVYQNPVPTVDIIIELESRGIVLIKRKNPPYGWAIPGGFVDYGESLEEAAVREAREETNLDVELIRQFHTYSDPKRDPRHHTITTAYIAKGKGKPEDRYRRRPGQERTPRSCPTLRASRTGQNHPGVHHRRRNGRQYQDKLRAGN